MRILHVVHRFLPRFAAGTEIYAASLAGALRTRGHDQLIFSGDPAASAGYTDEWHGLPIEAIPWGLGWRPGPVRTFLAGFGNPQAEQRFAQTCRAFKPDVAHVHHLMGLSPRLISIARAHGARVVVTLHDFWYVCSNTWLYRYSHQLCPGPGLGYHCGGCALQRLGRQPQPLAMALAAPIFAARTAWLRRALLAADTVIAPSTAVARVYRRHGVPPGLMRLLPHGLGMPGQEHRSPAPPEDQVRFVYIGPFIRPKGAHVVVSAFLGLSDPRAQLHLYGDQEADPAYTAELRLLAADPRVTLRGTLSRAGVRAVLAAADVLVLPSLWYEAHSLVVDEAFEAGLPVLVSDHSAAAERVQDGVNGLVAPPGDVAAWRQRMARLLDEPGLLARLQAGVTAPARLADHARQIETIYLQVLAPAAERAGLRR